MQQQMQDMITDPRTGRLSYVPQTQLPPSYQMHPQQQPPQPPHPQQAAAAAAFQYRQAMSAANQHNNNHHPSTQHQQYMQQVQWDGFGNNNKVSAF